MWVILALVSSVCLGVYDIFKKVSVRGNNVLAVLMLNTLFGTLLLSPVLMRGGLGADWAAHGLMIVKAAIVLSSWILGYFAIKHLPLTIQGPINATRPVVVLVGAVCLLGERLNALQWIGVLLGFTSLYLIARLAKKDDANSPSQNLSQGQSPSQSSKSKFKVRVLTPLQMSLAAMVLGAVSALYDKYLLRTFQPLDVQAWYSLYQCLMMAVIVAVLSRSRHHSSDRFRWRWTIPCISIFITIADIAYFHALSLDGSMVSIVSMIRRGSVLVSFLYGVVALHERNIRAKALDLSILLLSLALLVFGSLHG